VLALALAACSAPAAAPGTLATEANGDHWRWAGSPVALVGRPTGLAFERDGPPVSNAASKTIRVEARCVGCSSATRLELDLTSPVPRYELDPGVAEAIVGTAVFPTEGVWRIEPLGGELIVRSPTSTQPPVVVVRPWSVPLAADCGPKQIEGAVASFARGFNAASSTELAQALSDQVDFSMTGDPLPTFATHARDEVVNYARARSLAGEQVYPYLVYAASIGDNAVDLIVYFVRQAPDIPSVRGYRTAAAGSRLLCSDLLLLRFNAGTLKD
jgi:hypothetical protein